MNMLYQLLIIQIYTFNYKNNFPFLFEENKSFSLVVICFESQLTADKLGVADGKSYVINPLATLSAGVSENTAT